MANEESKLPEILGRLRESADAKDTVSAKVDPMPEAVQRYAPPSIRKEKKTNTNLQTIGEFVTRLTYRESMAMGKGIHAKIKSVGSDTSAEDITAAIQNWAWEWETFEDEQRPGSKE